MNRLCIIIALMACCLPMASRTITDKLDGHPNVKLTQPEALRQRLMPAVVADGSDAHQGHLPESASAATAGGYRIQVFSDNNPRTAKREAHAKAEAIGAAFPQWGTYISYDSPYWRLRVGDFRSYDDATHAVVELKNAFPAWRKELRVVRDKIRVPASE